MQIHRMASDAQDLFDSALKLTRDEPRRAQLQEEGHQLIQAAYLAALEIGGMWHDLRTKMCRRLAVACQVTGRHEDAAEYFRLLGDFSHGSLTVYGRAKYGEVVNRRRIRPA
jgi:hypothetical protein